MERDVLGAPGIPPARVAAWATTLRRTLLGAHRRSAPPPVQVLEALFASFDAHVLRALVELDIPDVLTSPTKMPELARRTGSDVQGLDRLMRYAAARGFVAIDRRGRVRPNGVTRVLRSDAAAPWRGWVEFAGSDWFDAAWRKLAESIGTDSPGAFELAHRASFFEFTTQTEPNAGEVFDRAMTAGATLQGIALSHTLDWSGTTSACDVGGGSGAALDAIQRYHPHVSATLFDLPEVIERSTFGDNNGGSRRTVSGGSFFDGVPKGHDRYLLLAIVHDWDDDAARTILENVRAAMGVSGEAIVVENVANERPRDDFAAASDLLMLVLADGRERTKHQYRALFGLAGLSVSAEHPLPTGATAFVLRWATSASDR